MGSQPGTFGKKCLDERSCGWRVAIQTLGNLSGKIMRARNDLQDKFCLIGWWWVKWLLLWPFWLQELGVKFKIHTHPPKYIEVEVSTMERWVPTVI